MFPVCGCGSSSSGSRFTLWFTHALPQLGASREAAFPAGAGPLLRRPKIIVKSPSQPSSRGGQRVRGGAVEARRGVASRSEAKGLQASK